MPIAKKPGKTKSKAKAGPKATRMPISRKAGKFKAFVPTDDQRVLVKNLAAFGITEDRIVEMILWSPEEGIVSHISETTLRRYFAEELATGGTTLIYQVATGLAATALDRKHPGHVASSIFILKARAGWKEKVQHEGKFDLNLDLSGATDEELAVIERFIVKKVEGTVPHHAPANDKAA